jgi:CelD/BcsL family acetyltransferase involved in cellulose biosynthesis
MEVEEVRDFPGLIPKWERLFSLCASPTPFLTWQWVSTWWKCFGKAEKPLLLTLGNGNDGLRAIAPLYVESGKLRMIGSEDLCDYQDFVVMKGEEKTSLRLLLSYVQEAYGLPLYMHSLPAFSPLFQLLREGRESNASARGKTERQDGFPIAYRKSLQDTTPVIHLPSS